MKPLNTSPQDLPLRDIHLPEAVSWWPPAIGWWLIPLLILAGIAVYFIYKKFYGRTPRHVNYKPIALQQLEQIRQHHKDTASTALLRELSSLLRRIALSYYPRESTASLTGERWFEQLNQLCPDARFTQQQQQLLSRAAYQPQAEFDAADIILQCAQWIQQLPEPEAGKTHKPFAGGNADLSTDNAQAV